MKNSSQCTALRFMLSMFCPILANLNYEHTESGNEHAKSKSSSKQKIHQTHLLLCLDESITLRSGAGISQC